MLRNNHEPFLNQIVTCDKSGILYDNWQQPAQWLDREEAPKHFLKPNLHQKKGYGPCFVICWWFDPLQLSECQWNHDIWEVFSTNQWDAPKPTMPVAMVNRKGPILLHNTWLHVTQTMLQKLNKLGYEILPHWPYLPDLSPTDYHFFKHLDNFLQGKCFHNQQEAENAFQEFLNSWSMDFYATGINNHFSLAKLCWL